MYLHTHVSEADVPAPATMPNVNNIQKPVCWYLRTLMHRTTKISKTCNVLKKKAGDPKVPNSPWPPESPAEGIKCITRPHGTAKKKHWENTAKNAAPEAVKDGE